MKKLFVFFMMFCLVISSNAQKKRAAAGGVGPDAALAAAGVVGAVAAAAYYEHQMREMVEQSAMEWALMNKEYENGDKLEMKLIEWEVKALTDISSTSNLLFKYKRNNEPYEVILFILSKGWWNENGIIFTKINPITIDKEFWNDILSTLIDVAYKDTSLVLLSNDSIQLKAQYKIGVRDKYGEYSNVTRNLNTATDFSKLVKMNGRTLFFELGKGDSKIDIKSQLVKIKGDEHIIGILDREDILLDYNEKRINLFNKSTRDLIKLNQSSVNEIHRLIYRQPLFFDAL